MKRIVHYFSEMILMVICCLLLFPALPVKADFNSLQKSWDGAMESYWEDQPNSGTFSVVPSSTVSVIDKAVEYGEKVKKVNPDVAWGWKGFSKFYNAMNTFYDAMSLYHYESPQEHAVFRWADEKAQLFKFAVDLFNFIPGSDNPIIDAEAFVIDNGYSFIDTPEVVHSLNNTDNLLLRILDPAFVIFSETEEFAWYSIRHFFTYDKDRQDQLAQDYIDNFDFIDRMKEALHIKVPNGVNAYKPNIYLYGPAGMETTVTFDRPELLTKVIPDYSGSWRTVIGADGSLYVNGMSDEEPGLSYLFYESDCDEFLMQTEKGWLIPAEEREATFRTILQNYGFNERETEDFARYWVEKLEPGVDYVMFPQDTDTVDLAMPVSLSGDIPEEIRRIWFYFLPADAAGDAVETPTEIVPIQRGASTMVEWGGVLR